MNCLILDLLLLFSGGLLAGTLGGLLGIGGGIILMPLLRFVVGLQPAYAAGTCIAAIFFTTMGGSYRYYKIGHLKFLPILPVIISGVIACALFSWLFLGLTQHERWLDLGIGLVFLLVAARMIIEGLPGLVKSPTPKTSNCQISGTLISKTSIGACGGLLPGLLGIGTGGILVPAFTYFLKAPVKIAMAASLACFCLNALVSSSIKLAQGFVVLEVVIPLGIGTFLGANLGALLNKRFSSKTVRLLFGLVFSFVAIKFILSFTQVKS